MKRLFLVPAAFALASAATPHPAAPPSVTVIHLSSFRFTPTEIRLPANRPATLIFINDRGHHDFSAQQFFARASSVAGPVRRGKVDLEAGERATVTLIPAAGTYRVKCGRFGHAMMGMTATIRVN